MTEAQSEAIMHEVAQTTPARGRSPVVRIALLLAGIAVLWLVGRWAGAYVEPFRQWVAGFGALGPVIFMVGYAVAVVAFVPGFVLTLAGGATFGVVEGTVYVFIAATVGATLAFLVARYVARESVARWVAQDRRFAAIDRVIGSQGRKIVFLLRLSPVFPFNVLNYGLGLTRISLRDYVLASVGMLPGTLLYVYLGYVGGEAAVLAGGGSERGTAELTLWVVGLIATVFVTVMVTRIARRALQEATDD